MKVRSEFLTPLTTEYLGYTGRTQYWKLKETLSYYCSRTKRVYEVPKGFVCDFASFKRMGWATLLIAMIFASLVNFLFSLAVSTVFLAIIALYAIAWAIWGERAHRAAVLHDYLYRQGYNTRTVNDKIFLDAMESTGYGFYIRYPMFAMVYLLGWLAYNPVPGCLDFRFCKYERSPDKCWLCKHHVSNHNNQGTLRK